MQISYSTRTPSSYIRPHRRYCKYPVTAKGMQIARLMMERFETLKAGRTFTIESKGMQISVRKARNRRGMLTGGVVFTVRRTPAPWASSNTPVGKKLVSRMRSGWLRHQFLRRVDILYQRGQAMVKDGTLGKVEPKTEVAQ